MREEIEAAALFLTRLVNKNLSNGGSTSSSIHSHSSSASSSLSSSLSTSSASSSSSTSSDSPPDFDEQQQQATAAATVPTSVTNGDQDKVEQFRQCLEEALYERFHNHWFPDQPTKGQAYRCIRLNEWDRRDITLQKACTQCGIDYKDLQLPVELTLWVDPDEVTCRFGETKGSHCLVAKFKDGELKVEQNNLNLDINNIDIEIFRQAEGLRQQANMHGSPEYTKQQNRLNNSSGNINHNNSYQYHHHHNYGSHHHHQQQQQQNHQPQHHHHQSSPHHHQHHQSPHRANIAKAAIFPSYHHDANGNPIPYYYF